MNSKEIRVLMIEDNSADAHLVKRIMSRAYTPHSHFHLEWVDTLQKGIELLNQDAFQVVLLDLGLPDSRGISGLIKLKKKAPPVPIIVLTGLDDEALGLETVKKGAQDYLVKGKTDEHLLYRSIQYAIERHRLQQQLEEAQQKEQYEKSLGLLELFSSVFKTRITAESFGVLPLSRSAPEIFRKCVEQYKDLLDKALEQKGFKVKHNINIDLNRLAEIIGTLKSGPRDVIEIHTNAVKELCDNIPILKRRAYLEEGRMLVLELMGDLALYYRNFSLNSKQRGIEK